MDAVRVRYFILFLYRLADVQELYQKRESRPEDLEMIEELKWAVVEKEESLQRLEVSHLVV